MYGLHNIVNSVRLLHIRDGRHNNEMLTSTSQLCGAHFAVYLATNGTIKGKMSSIVIARQVDTATTEALRYMARTKQRRTYLS